MAGAGNSINETTTGICGFTGTAFTGTAVTAHNVILGGSTSSTLVNVAPSATSGIPLVSAGSSSDPSFTTAVVQGGGTGRTTLTNHGVLVGAGTTAITQLGAGSSGQVLQSGGASADPAYSTATYPATATGTGTILRADGTNWVASTATYPATTTINQILYSSSANVVAGLSTTNRAVLTTTSSGVPQLLALTDGQIIIGSTAGAPAAATLTAGTNVTITNAGNSITIAASGGGTTFAYTNVNHAASPYTVLNADYYLSVDTSGGVVTINLPNAPTTNTQFIIKDRLGSAATSNITVKSLGGVTTVDGQASLLIANNYGAIQVVYNGSNYEVF